MQGCNEHQELQCTRKDQFVVVVKVVKPGKRLVSGDDRNRARLRTSSKEEYVSMRVEARRKQTMVRTLCSGYWRQWGSTKGIGNQNKLNESVKCQGKIRTVQEHTRIRIIRVEVPGEHDKENDCQREGSNFETPSDKAMTLCYANHRVENSSNEETHDKPTNVG